VLERLKIISDYNQYQPGTPLREGTALSQTAPDNAVPSFMAFVTDLYKGNGYIVSPLKHSGQIYLGLSYPQKPDAIILIVKTNFHKKPISYDTVRAELINLEIVGSKYNCNQYCLVAPSGFDDEVQMLKQFNLLLYDIAYLEELSKSFSPSNIKEPQVQLFSHNQQTYENVKKKFQESKTVAVVQATGTGKSYLIAKLLSDFKGVKKLVMAPSNYIIDQLKEHIRWEIETIFMTYAKGMYVTEAEIKALNVGFIVLDEFHRCGAEEWGKSVQNILNAYSEAYVFGTSATPIRYMDNSRDMSAELFNGNVAENLSLAQAIIKRILPMPKYVSALYTLDTETENIKEKINNSKHTTTIKNNLLQEIDTFRIDWEKSAGIPQVLKKHLEPEMTKFIVFCKEEDHLNEMEKTVQGWFVKAGINKPIKTYRVLNADSDSDKNLLRFKNDTSSDCIHLLFSINMLNEGLHVKDVQGVILLRPTESPNIFYQQIGRCLKVGINHSAVIFDFVNNFKTIRANDFMYELDFYRTKEQHLRNEAGLQDQCPEFKIIDEVREITEVFGKINFQISSWEIRYEELVAYKEEFGNCDVQVPRDKNGIGKNQLQLAFWVRYNRTQYKDQALSEERIQKLNAIGFEWALGEWIEWEDQFEKLIKFKERFGHLKVTQRWKEDPTFGKWVYRQRQNYKQGILSAEKIEKLNNIGFELSEQIIPDVIWEKYFEELKKYKQNFGDCNVSTYWKGSRKLGMWVSHQRNNYKKGRFLSLERINKLNALGFEWNLRYKKTDEWEKFYQLLIDFKSRNGHCNVPHNYKENEKLSRWVKNQRIAQYNHLTSERKQKLNQIGFVWHITYDFWHKMVESLSDFYKKNNHFYVPMNLENGKLCNWITNIRSTFRKGRLSEAKIESLNKIGFSFELHSRENINWNKKLIHLKKNKPETGNWDLLKTDESTRKLLKLLFKQYKENLLSADKLKECDELGINFNSELFSSPALPHILKIKGKNKGEIDLQNEQSWLLKYQDLKEFTNKFGHPNVPSSFKENKTLASWVNNQRINRKKEILAKERIEKLNELNFRWKNENRILLSWESNFEILQQFKDGFGHCNVPKNWEENEHLSLWVNNQRGRYKINKLSSERIILLESIGFIWFPSEKYNLNWEQNFNALLEFKKEHGHCNVPANWQANVQLSYWIQNLRSDYKKQKTTLTKEKIKRLQEIGFIFFPLENAWNFKFSQLLDFKQKYGHCNVVYRWKEHPGLGDWTATQRNAYKNGQLTPDRIQKFNEIGFEWNVK